MRTSRHIFIAIFVLFVVALHVIQLESRISLDEVKVMNIRGDHLLHVAIFLPWMSLVRLNLSGKSMQSHVHQVSGIKTGKLYSITRLMINSPFFWFLTGLLLAAVAESIQYLLPYRSFNLMDMLSNAAGVVLGSIVYLDRFFRN
jgi:hypothetical protein